MGYGHTYVGSEHMLYGLVSDDSFPSASVLRRYGVGRNEVLRRLETLVGKGRPTRLSMNDLTPRSRRLMENALSFAAAEDKRKAGTEHLLRAVVLDRECCAWSILAELGVNMVKLAGEVCAQRYVEPGLPAERKRAPREIPGAHEIRQGPHRACSLREARPGDRQGAGDRPPYKSTAAALQE